MGLLQNIFGKKESAVRIDYSEVITDMHSHLIPGIDDGAQTIEDSVILIRELYNMGFRKVITTPHIMSDYYKNTPENNIDTYRIQPLSELTSFLDDLDPQHGNPEKIADLAHTADRRTAETHLKAVSLAADAAIEAQFAEYPETLAILRGLFEERNRLSELSRTTTDAGKAELAEEIQDITERIQKISQGDDSA